MSFVSPGFLLFLPAVLALSRFTPWQKRWMVLLPASYFFYACHSPWLLSLIFLTTLVSYASALRIERAETRKQKRRAVVLDAVVCLGILFLFKYLDFALGGVFSLLRLFGVESGFTGFHLLLPMGISFYVFQTMSYTFDVYRGTIRAERHLGYYALFVSFFPQLVAGPIERPGDLLPQLKAPNLLEQEDIAQGVRFLVRGYGKKVLISDFLAPFVDTAYGDAAGAGGAAMVLATVLFALQIYCDFSGYSDIAMGCARLMGIRLTENFRQPYAAGSIRDFWRRWHISLTRWFTDYLYIPLGGSRRGLFRQCVNILVVFLVSGLWHGANLTFVVWGGLHGLFLTAETLLLGKRQLKSPLGRGLHRAVTLVLVCFAWVFFRASDLSQAAFILRSIFTDFRLSAALTGLGMGRMELMLACLLVLLLPLLERLPALRVQENRTQGRYAVPLLYFLLIAAIVICRCLVLTEHGATAFIYFQF